jgi:hypothetical protein
MLIRKSAFYEFDAEYANVDKLRSAFWDAISKWRKWNESDQREYFWSDSGLNYSWKQSKDQMI